MAIRIIILCMFICCYFIESNLFACPWCCERAIFTYSLHPDFPLEEFARGNLGILQPTYARSYLCVAYRYLIGENLNKKEQKSVLSLWNHRLNRRQWDEDIELGQNKWLEARSKVLGVSPSSNIKSYDKCTIYSWYCNYLKDAFQTAVNTLNERIKIFGIDSKEVREWLNAQDAVFTGSIPEPADTRLHPLIQADRKYQIAAAYFYRGDFDKAEEMFKEIANDPSSPWRKISTYLVARALIRKAILAESDEDEVDRVTLTKAKAQLENILKDKTLVELHPASNRLLNFVLFRLQSREKRILELAQAILDKDSPETLGEEVGDYTLLLNCFVYGHHYNYYDSNISSGKLPFDQLPEFIKKDELGGWIVTFQSNEKSALEHSLKRWDETSSLPWLVASLSKIDGSHPRLSGLLRRAKNVEQDSPGFLMITFHAIRLMIESGKKDEARDMLDSLSSRKDLIILRSSFNLFLSLRMKVARNLEEFLRYTPRVPTGITCYVDFDMSELPGDPSPSESQLFYRDWWMKPYKGRHICFDLDSVSILNERIPLVLLKEAAKSKVLPLSLRREVASAAWVRAILLDDEKTALELVPLLEGLLPKLKGYLKTYKLAKNKESRKFAAIFLILNFPGMRPYVSSGLGRDMPLNKVDRFYDNWWGCFGADAKDLWIKSEVRILYYDYPNEWRILGPLGIFHPAVGFPDFIGAVYREQVEEELKKLYLIGPAPNYFCAQVLSYAKKYTKDARIPKALHLAVVATRYGRGNEETGKFSRDAFRFLHKRYPKSTWAKKTPYWYK